MLKPGLVKGNIEDSESTYIYIGNILDKYAKCPDHLDKLCLAGFASPYRNEGSYNPPKNDESLEAYTEPISDFIETPESTIRITLKDDLGKMKK